MNGYRGFWEVVEAAGVAAMCGRRESTTIDDIRDRVNIVGSVSDRGWFMASSVRRCGRRGGRAIHRDGRHHRARQLAYRRSLGSQSVRV